jgi:hypothetical protein
LIRYSGNFSLLSVQHSRRHTGYKYALTVDARD